MAVLQDLGGRIAPPRFILFVVAFSIAVPVAHGWLDWREALMAGFDVAALLFFVAIAELFNDEADEMREAARRNDANRVLLLILSSTVMLVILTAVVAELKQKQAPDAWSLALALATLVLAWTFSNIIYALHYAHLFYDRMADGSDGGGIAFPKTKEPDYWDFVYFSVCLGMTFQTSDVDIESGRIRRVVTLHCLAAFIFNLGVIAFTINILGSGG